MEKLVNGACGIALVLAHSEELDHELHQGKCRARILAGIMCLKAETCTVHTTLLSHQFLLHSRVAQTKALRPLEL